MVQNVDLPMSSNSLADELAKLVSLNKDILLSKEGFEGQKAKLLA